jgi:hypothetical protein
VTNELAKTSFFANKFHQKVISAKYAEEARPRHQLRLLCYVLYVVCCSTLAVYMTTRDALGASLTRSGVIQGLGKLCRRRATANQQRLVEFVNANCLSQ